MEYYYVEDNERKGPIDTNSFNQLVNSNIITDDTLIWKEGMDNWQPFKEVKILNNQPVSAPISLEKEAVFEVDGYDAPKAYCTICGTKVAQDTLMAYEKHRVCLSCKPNFVRRLSEGSPTQVQGDLVYGSRWRRLGASILDSIILFTIYLVVVGIPFFMLVGSNVSGGNFNEQEMASIFGGVWITLISWVIMPVSQAFYEAFFMAKMNGATPGKKILSIRVVYVHGGGLSFWQAFGRGLSKYLSGLILYIGYIMILFDSEEKRCLHDHICNSRVIDTRHEQQE